MAKAADPARAFLGAGLAFPFGADPKGALGMAVYEEDIRQAIRIILETNPGERVMRPDFGAGLRAFVFEPLSVATMHRVERRVREALIDFEPRIDLMEVIVKAGQIARGELLIDITYRVRTSNSVMNLVYPFYLGEGQRR
jgi:phage baseplate assembly protein W